MEAIRMVCPLLSFRLEERKQEERENVIKPALK